MLVLQIVHAPQTGVEVPACLCPPQLQDLLHRSTPPSRGGGRAAAKDAGVPLQAWPSSSVARRGAGVVALMPRASFLVPGSLCLALLFAICSSFLALCALSFAPFIVCSSSSVFLVTSATELAVVAVVDDVVVVVAFGVCSKGICNMRLDVKSSPLTASLQAGGISSAEEGCGAPAVDGGADAALEAEIAGFLASKGRSAGGALLEWILGPATIASPLWPSVSGYHPSILHERNIAQPPIDPFQPLRHPTIVLRASHDPPQKRKCAARCVGNEDPHTRIQ